MSRSRSHRSDLDRRSVLIAGTAVVGAAAIPGAAIGAQDPGLAPAGDLLAAVRKFTGSLEPEKLKAASFAWNGPEWLGWNYFGIGGFTKPGLRLEQMSAAQKEAAWGIVGSLMSPAGVAKTRNVMLLQDILAASGNRASERSSERFSFSVFGTPAETGAWGFRLEGHHLTHSIAVRDNRIVSVTPASFSALPNRVTSGKHAGLVTLRDEDALARRLLGDLPPKLQARARASDNALGNILSYAGRERSNAQKVGLPAAELGSSQRDLLWQLVETFAVDHLSPTLATAQRARIGSGDRAAAHFAWYGPNTPEKAFGYRVIGDGFVIELGSVDPAAQHLHTIYHDLGNVLGRVV